MRPTFELEKPAEPCEIFDVLEETWSVRTPRSGRPRSLSTTTRSGERPVRRNDVELGKSNIMKL